MSIKIKLFIILLILFWSSLFICLFSISISYNALSEFFFKRKHDVQILFPEGWSFFTRDPQETRNFFLINENGHWIQDPRIRNATLENYGGIDRTGRVVALVYYGILNTVQNERWYYMSDEAFSKFNIDHSSIPSVNVPIKRRDDLHLPSQLIILRKNITPWAYRKFENHTGDTLSFIKINLALK